MMNTFIYKVFFGYDYVIIYYVPFWILKYFVILRNMLYINAKGKIITSLNKYLGLHWFDKYYGYVIKFLSQESFCKY